MTSPARICVVYVSILIYFYISLYTLERMREMQRIEQNRRTHHAAVPSCANINVLSLKVAYSVGMNLQVQTNTKFRMTTTPTSCGVGGWN